MSVLHSPRMKGNLRRSLLTCKLSFSFPSRIDSPSWKSPPAFKALTCASLSFKAFSNILTYFFKLLLLASLFLVLPSSRAILPFISCLSISHPFRSRSCLCHSVWRKRITPGKWSISTGGRANMESTETNLAAYIPFPGAGSPAAGPRHCHYHLHSSPPPCCQTRTARPSRPHSPRHRSNRSRDEETSATTTTQFAPKLFLALGIC